MSERDSKHGPLGEIQRQLGQLLAARGTSGKLEIRPDKVVLSSHTGARQLELGDLATAWPTLNRSTQERRLQQLAAQLNPTPTRPRSVPAVLALSAIVVTSSLVGSALILGILRAADESVPTLEPTATGADRIARSERVCEMTRSRVMRGGTAGPTDHEGWALELALLRPVHVGSLLEATRLRSYVDISPRTGSSLSWSPLPTSLRHKQTARLEVREKMDDHLRNTIFSFDGEYVRTYFDEQTRIHWFRLANALARDFGVVYAGLYARCAHLTSREVATWFFGKSPQHAVTSLLWFLGNHKESSLLHVRFLTAASGTPLSDAEQLKRIFAAVGDVDKQRLASWLANEGGLVSGEDHKPTLIRFPYKDSNRAARAARRFARRLRMAPSSP